MTDFEKQVEEALPDFDKYKYAELIKWRGSEIDYILDLLDVLRPVVISLLKSADAEARRETWEKAAKIVEIKTLSRKPTGQFVLVDRREGQPSITAIEIAKFIRAEAEKEQKP